MDFWQALCELGVRDDTLTAVEKQSLDRDGYLLLEDIYTREQAARMLAEHRKLWAIEKTGQEGGENTVVNTQNKCGCDAYDVCFTHPRVVAAIAHVLREEFVSLGVHAAGPHWPPADENQPLHTDCRGQVSADTFYCCNSMWPLADFTADNGPTRVVPGSHLFGAVPGDALDDPIAPHPDEVMLIGPVGTVAIFNAHVWHGATANPERIARPNCTSFWSRRQFHDGTRMENHLSRDAYERLGAGALCLFDPPEDGAG